MPELCQINGIRVFFYSNDGSLEGLPRVHVSQASAEAEFLISQDSPPIVMLKRSHGFKCEDLKLIHDHITDLSEEIRNAWSNLFC